MRYESITRAYLQSRTRVWAENGIVGDAFSDLPLGFKVCGKNSSRADVKLRRWGLVFLGSRSPVSRFVGLLRPGEMATFYRDVARPEGRIHFAREHTSPMIGTMEGAAQWGIRAAEEFAAAQS